MEQRAIIQQKLQIAEHFLNTTYPLIQEPKLLVSVIDNLLQAFEQLITITLEHKKYHVPEGFEEKFELFKQKIIIAHNIDTTNLECIQTLKDIIHQHKATAVEFTRKQTFVITDDNYNLQTLTYGTTKDLFEKTKALIEHTLNHTQL